jgi:hypothetical protein
MYAKFVHRLTMIHMSLIIGLLLQMMVTRSVAAQVQDETHHTPGPIYLPLVSGSNAQIALEHRALDRIAARHGLSADDLMVLHTTSIRYDSINQSGYAVKVLDQQSGAIYGIALAESGNELDTEQLMAAEQAAHAARYGRLDPTLADELANANQDNALGVILWLKMPTGVQGERLMVAAVPDDEHAIASAPDLTSSGLAANYRLAQSGQASDQLMDEPTGQVVGVEDLAAGGAENDEPAPVDLSVWHAQAQQEAFFAQMDARRAAAISAVARPVTERLQTLGAATIIADPYAPVIFTELTPDDIKVAAAWPEVETLYLDQLAQSTLDVARQTVNVHVVNSRGVTGAGIKVAQIEVGGRIATNNPYLSGVVQDLTYSCDQSHATWVAGAIRSTHATQRGMAPAVSLWAGGSCAGNDAQLHNRAAAAANWGAVVLNLSYVTQRSRETPTHYN